MGRALAALGPNDAPSPGTTAKPVFQAQGLEYRIERRDGQVYHVELRRDAQGQIIAKTEAAVQYALGSGTRGLGYLIDRDGYLFQSPISWYAQERKWDLSPGYRKVNPHFERMIDARCLFCHCNYAEEVPYTFNRFQEPIFRGLPIGCERCHGPGERHVQIRQGGQEVAAADEAIVNPRRLAPELREAVCQQCHLQGQARVVRAHHRAFDYRPGEPLQAFLSVFVSPAEFNDNHKAVSQVEQMSVSRCFRKSNGAMGCISCHDPHRVPAATEKTAYYREKCLECHTKQGCSLPRDARLQKSKDDSCIACHMAPLHTSNIAHTAMTDHRIRRYAEAPDQPAPAPRPLRRAEIPLLHFHRKPNESADPGINRDLGLALTVLARDAEGTPFADQLGRLALPLLEEATTIDPNDVFALHGYGYSLWLGRREREALAVYERALAKEPNLERTLVEAAQLAVELGDRDGAIRFWQRAIRVDPYRSNYHAQLAELEAARQDWAAARDSCRSALRLNAMRTDVRKLLIKCNVKLGSDIDAKSDLAILLRLEPADAESLKKWFSELRP